MSIAGDLQLTTIRRRLVCLDCGYDLQGQSGDIVTCPECGLRCDLPKLIAANWQGPWYRTPGYGKLLVPVTWLLTTCWVVFLVYVYEVESAGGTGVVAITVAATVIAVWIVLLRRTLARFDSDRGAWLLIASHVLPFGYLAGAAGLILGLWRALAFGGTITMFVWLLVATASGAVVYACYRGERFLAEQCIRQRLIDQATKRAAT